jgi:regulator of replication initiation timing
MYRKTLPKIDIYHELKKRIEDLEEENNKLNRENVALKGIINTILPKPKLERCKNDVESTEYIKILGSNAR